jgi:hypothetical protein
MVKPEYMDVSEHLKATYLLKIEAKGELFAITSYNRRFLVTVSNKDPCSSSSRLELPHGNPPTRSSR